jgi:hypothetical protein
MNIAALSIGLNQASLKQSMSIALTKKVMDQAQANNQGLLQMMQQSAPQAPHPTSGHSIDIKL